MKKCFFLLTMSAGAVLAPVAQAGDWEFSLGANYRAFDEIDYDNYALENPNHTGGTAVLDNGVTYTDNGATIFLEMANVGNPVNFDPPPGNVNDATLHQASVTGQSGDIDEGVGVVLGARKDICKLRSGYTLGLDLSLTTAFSDTANRVSAPVDNINLTGLNSNPYIGSKNLAAGSVGADVEASVNYDLDLAVYTFGTGMSGAYEQGPWAFRLGAGPTLTLTDYDISRSEVVSFNSGTSTIYTDAVDDDGLDLDLGAYISAGVDYDITGNIGVGLSIRYDWVYDGGPDTDVADLDLSGASGLLQLLYTF